MRYYYLSRPPGVGCQPGKWLRRRSYSPPRVPPRTLDDYAQRVHGWVDYEGALDYYMIWRYDLIPSDLAERARFLIARDIIDFGQGQGQDQRQVDRMVGEVIQRYVDHYGVTTLSAMSFYAADYILELVCIVIRQEDWEDWYGTN